MNYLACLRLTQRCADILISVRQEIFEAGDILAQELVTPIQRLEEYVLYDISIRANLSHLIARSFQGVHYFLTKQTSRPFLKRYLRRDEIMCDLSDCDCSLRDALGLFGVSFETFAKSLSYSQLPYRFRFKFAYLNKFRKRRNIGRRRPRCFLKRS